MENFAAPYLRRNIAEFWRAWHISLTSFLRDYIFLPLGYRYSRSIGPRNAAYLATIVTFVACGIWHGSGWNFILWGLYHGVLLVLHQLFLQRTKRIPLFQRLRKQRWLAAPSTLVTFLFVCGSWYLFAFTLPQLVMIFRGIIQ